MPSSPPSQAGPADPRLIINEILDFWFALPYAAWFGAPSPAFPTPESLDAELRGRFLVAMGEARAGRLDDTWTRTPRGALALLLLLDQFPRNVHRGSGEAFATDARAVEVAVRALARGFDRAFGRAEADGGRGEEAGAVAGGGGEGEGVSDTISSSLVPRVFFYLPLCHAEDLTAQIAATALSENLLKACPDASPERPFLERSVGFFQMHRDVIFKLGRFPARNKALGRESTQEEVEFLRERPEGL
ncbi:hypothetical protein F5Y19DRAFT_469868 [Xylariaceae sp. FL1651]|nr:hypothetical protein F5Y19DRAFT_469868 [Xylariaceae sp. FL1651]